MLGKVTIISTDFAAAEDKTIQGLIGRTCMITIHRKFPSVGDTIAILHSVKRNSAGEVLGVHRADSVAVDTISAVYLDGTVRTGLGDVWEVQAASGESKATKGAKWATINPMHGKGSN